MITCSDNQQYSWQVVPQQSPLPLFTGGPKLVQTLTNTRKLRTFFKIISGGIILENCKRKKEPKKENTMEWAIAHNLLLRFFKV